MLHLHFKMNKFNVQSIFNGTKMVHMTNLNIATWRTFDAIAVMLVYTVLDRNGSGHTQILLFSCVRMCKSNGENR